MKSLFIGVAVVTALAPVVAAAQTAAPAATPVAAITPAASDMLALKMGTNVPLKTLTALSSKTTKVGDRFDLVVASDVLADGRVVIPAGSPALGEVTSVTKKGAFGRSGKLETRLLYLDVGAKRVALNGQTDTAGKGGTAGTVAAAVAVGVFSAFVTGKSALIAAGSPMTGYTTTETMLAAVVAAPTSPIAAPVEAAAAPVK